MSKGDFTRDTFDREKHYRSVRMQQGRVQLDADWNEAEDIQNHLRETAVRDLIGPCGAPQTEGGFRIESTGGGAHLVISPGRLYVDGILCELASPTKFDEQPDLPGESYPTQDGSYLAYLDVWERHLTWFDDPEIRETALGGPDTATRLKTVCQVRLLRLGAVEETVDCLSKSELWDEMTDPSSGRLRAQARPQEASDEPCIVPASAGFTGLENQLYRVEIHLGGTRDQASFKWSRENGSVVAACTGKKNDNKLTVGSTGRDAVLGIRKDDCVELIDDGKELRGEPGTMLKVVDVQEDEVEVTPPVTTTLGALSLRPKLRRWESAAKDMKDLPAAGWFPLEHGIEVQFGDGTYRTGDYWLIPARAFIGPAAGDIEWPREPGPQREPSPLPSHGITHHYCRLAVVERAGGTFTVLHDCRPLFPALTELVDFFPAGGDGQEGMLGEKLPCSLSVGVTNGRWPVVGARVQFTTTNGKLTSRDGNNESDSVEVPTVDGIASCEWKLPETYDGTGRNCLQVTATLLDAADHPVSTPVFFHANPSLARLVQYEPAADCRLLAGTETVQAALDRICGNFSLQYVGGGGQNGKPSTWLEFPLEVRVANGRSPQPGAKVRFSITRDDGSGYLSLDRNSSNGSRQLDIEAGSVGGVATCHWFLDREPPTQRVRAHLLDSAGEDDVSAGPVDFEANIVAPPQEEQGISIQNIYDPHNTANPLENDSEVTDTRLAGGIRVVCNEPVADLFPLPFARKYPGLPPKPNFEVVLYLPYPWTPDDKNFWEERQQSVTYGYQPLLLAATVSVTNNGILWQPAATTASWLTSIFAKLPTSPVSGGGIDHLLVRLTLRGDFIWSAGDPKRFLHGRVRGMAAGGRIAIDPSKHGPGDFEMWFWLVRGSDGTKPPEDDFILDATAVENAPRSAWQISGTIKAATGRPLSGVKVKLNPGAFEATSGDDGSFKFPPQPFTRPLQMSVRAELGGRVKEVEVREGPPLAGAKVRTETPAAELQLTDVVGVGRSTRDKLTQNGIASPAELASAAPDRLAEILGVSEEKANSLIESAKRLLESR